MHKIVATFFGLGYAPKASGTIGALGGILVYGALRWLGINNWLFLLLLLILFFLGVYSFSEVEEVWGKDNGKVVIDEVVGIWVSLLYIPFQLEYYLLGFVLFRILDIWKPLLIRKTEKLKSGWGVMADDLLAGIYTNLILQALLLWSK